jgi:5'-nucleotidase
VQLPLPLPELAQIASTLPGPEDRIYVNRSLRLDQIDWVGFDMDYTLAIYHQDHMDRLSIDATCRKLCDRGYPETLLGMPYRTDFPIRGLLVDKKLGNVIKMDRFKYVKRAYHGMRELSREERRQAYHTRKLRPASARYHWVDSLYALSEVTVYAAAIEALEATGEHVDHDRLFADVRECIDLSHRDGSILDEIVGHLERYVFRDPALGQTLHLLRSAGKKIFLLTNSYPAYTEKMMAYLFEAQPGGRNYRDWRSYFDLVITAATKPAFFAGDGPLMRVASPDDPPEAWTPHQGATSREHTYAGGSIVALQELLGCSPDRVLYVGDHIYGDVLRATKSSAWRTMLILQEMDVELQANDELEHSIARLDGLLEIRDQLLDDLREHQAQVRSLSRRKEAEGLAPAFEAERVRHRRAVDRLRQRLKAIEHEYDQLEAGVSHRFHPFWGSLFKAGPETSAFGNQVENYANLYTARVSNLCRYSPAHYFHSPRDRMPHELTGG